MNFDLTAQLSEINSPTLSSISSIFPIITFWTKWKWSRTLGLCTEGQQLSPRLPSLLSGFIHVSRNHRTILRGETLGRLEFLAKAMLSTCHATPCQVKQSQVWNFSSGLHDHEDTDTAIYRNVRSHLPVGTALPPRKTLSCKFLYNHSFLYAFWTLHFSLCFIPPASVWVGGAH